MSSMNKLSMLSTGSVARLTQKQTPGKVENSSLRQDIAGGGKFVPSQQPAHSTDDKKKELNYAVKNLSGYIQNISRELNFSVDKEVGKTVVTVVDEATGDIIRQIPNEEVLELSKRISEIRGKSAKGLLFSGNA